MDRALLKHPLEDFKWSENTTQLFGVNSEFYKANFGAPGHQGIDYRADKLAPKNGYGTKIISAHMKSALCTQVSVDTTIRTRGNGVYLLEELDDGQKLETIYWHVADIHIRPGEIVGPQQSIGMPAPLQRAIAVMGNTGFVRPSPTPYFPWNGTHCHFAVKKYDKSGRIIRTEYPGDFIDPTPLLFREGDKLPIRFTRTLFIGSTGDEVSWLQTILKIEGFAQDYEPIAYFGVKTARDVRLLQQKYAISSSMGYVGEITRRFLMQKYSLYA